MPSTYRLSFTPTGMPSRGPRLVPALLLLSDSLAAVLAELPAWAADPHVIGFCQTLAVGLGLIGSVVNAHNAEDAEIIVQGPSVRLSPLQATTFALIINELASNALKHGAMSTPAGRVSIIWDRRDERLLLDWRESGGPIVSERGAAGFGTMLIRRAAALQVGGSADLVFEPAGIACHIELALTEEEAAKQP